MQPAIPALTNFMAAVGGTSGGFRPTMVAEGLEGEEGFVGEPGGCGGTGPHVGVLFGGRGDDVPRWLLMALVNSQKPYPALSPPFCPREAEARGLLSMGSSMPTLPYPTPAITGGAG